MITVRIITIYYVMLWYSAELCHHTKIGEDTFFFLSLYFSQAHGLISRGSAGQTTAYAYYTRT